MMNMYMDILQEYEKTQVKAPLPSTVQTQEQLLAQRYVPDTGFFVRLVMRLSGGRIRDARQASLVLLIISALIVALSIIIFLYQGRSGSRSPHAGEIIYPQGQPPRLRTPNAP